jgi:acyl carrier protein
MRSLASKDDVRSLLLKLLQEIGNIPLERIHDASTVDTDLKMESVVFIEIQVALEDAYDVELDTVRIVEINRFDRIVEYIYYTIVANNSE